MTNKKLLLFHSNKKSQGGDRNLAPHCIEENEERNKMYRTPQASNARNKMADENLRRKETLKTLGDRFDQIAGFQLTDEQKDSMLKKIIVKHVKPIKTDNLFTTEADPNFSVFTQNLAGIDDKCQKKIDDLTTVSPHVNQYEKDHSAQLEYYNKVFRDKRDGFYDELNSESNVMEYFTRDEWFTEPERSNFKKTILDTVSKLDINKKELLTLLEGATNNFVLNADFVSTTIDSEDSNRFYLAALSEFVHNDDEYEPKHEAFTQLELISEVASSKEAIFEQGRRRGFGQSY